MRIYLDKLWLNINFNKIENILSSCEELIYLYSIDGIYIIQNNKLMKMEIYL